MTKSKRDSLRRLAKAADSNGAEDWYVDEGLARMIRQADYSITPEAHANYISAARPAVMLELLNIIEKQQEVLLDVEKTLSELVNRHFRTKLCLRSIREALTWVK